MQLAVGNVVEGKVTGITNFGAFVELEDGKTGMVHISEVASSFVKDIHEHLKEGQTVKVKVLSVGEDGKISLSIKRAEEPKREPSSRPPRSTGNNNNRFDFRNKVSNEPMSFEDMMNNFKKASDEKMSDLKRSMDAKQRGGYPKRGTNSYK